MSTDEYVPSEDQVRLNHQRARTIEVGIREAGAEFDRFLARVKRDAAREALDGLAEWHDREAAMSGPGSHYWDASNHVATSARHHRDTHYPIPEESP